VRDLVPAQEAVFVLAVVVAEAVPAVVVVHVGEVSVVEAAAVNDHHEHVGHLVAAGLVHHRIVLFFVAVLDLAVALFRCLVVLAYC
jgi:hypothetical protein